MIVKINDQNIFPPILETEDVIYLIIYLFISNLFIVDNFS